MPVYCRVYLAGLFSLLVSSSFAQDKIFTLQNNPENRIVVNNTFSASTEISPFTFPKPVTGLGITCEITFNSDSGLIRITLVDQKYREFLICEAYPLLTGSNHVTLTDFAEETASLADIVPGKIRIEIADASVHLKEIVTSRNAGLRAKAAADISREQNSEKITRINNSIKKLGGKWVAGETSVSKMTYEEKRQLFGGRLPNLQGFEYYVGGIYVLPGTNMLSSLSQESSSPFAAEFSWRNRHGQDWVTPVRNQGWCGSCWAFAAMGSTELLVNLYYNEHLDFDLSEQEAVSCFGVGNCIGGDPGATLDHIKDFGVVTESCFSYAGWDEPCSDKCENPSEIIKIGGREYSQWLTDSIAKKMLIEGPVSCSISSWAHALTLVGYKTIKEGDNIFNIIIPAGHPYIGRTAWLLKNSWGEDWGDEGYLYTLSNIDNLRFSEVFPPVSSKNLTDSDISCLDEDGDGYYNWGIGPKPLHCPPSPDQADGDDSNPCLGPMDKYGNIHFFTQVTSAKDVTVLYGDTVPDLAAEGEDIRWYADKQQISLLHTGSTFSTGQIDPGIYTYYVTQTLSGCESDILPVKLMIYLNVPPPVAENIITIIGEPTPQLVASGENIKWYADSKNPFYDYRDGQTYKTTFIGNQLWMAENLNFYTPTGSFYYDNDSLANARIYGRLYDFTVFNSCPTELNWHLPTDDEWIEMEMYLGMNKEETHNQAFRGAGIGGKLKETDTLYWIGPNTDATDEVGFRARPGGSYENGFSGVRSSACFLAFAEYYSGVTYLRTIDINSDKIGRSMVNSYSPTAYSVRCISNPSKSLSVGNTYKPVYVMPGKYTYYVTQTISGFESPADTVVFTILSDMPAPEADNVTVCENKQVTDLIAHGENVRWYSDRQLSKILHSGSTFSPRQTSPGTYIYYVTQSDSNYESLPDTVILTIKPAPRAPVSSNLLVLEGDMNQILEAAGENIKWYIHGDSSAIATGNSYNPLLIEPGEYRYEVTQTVLGCESPAGVVVLTVMAVPPVPVAGDVTICEGEALPELSAAGENIRWYGDSMLANLLYTGNSFIPVQTEAGIYTYFVTQTISGFESAGKRIAFTINPKPIFNLGKDTLISLSENLILGPFNDAYTYHWNSGSELSYLVLSGSVLGPGIHMISVTVTRNNTCEVNDTLFISVVTPTGMDKNMTNSSILVYPNPTYGQFYIKLSEPDQEDILVKIINENGMEIKHDKYSYMNNSGTILLDLYLLPRGIYYINILTSKIQYSGKIILQ